MTGPRRVPGRKAASRRAAARKGRARPGRQRRPAARTVLTAETVDALGVPVVRGKDGDTLTVVVDVEKLSVPYTVTYDTRTLMHSLVDRQEAVTLAAGTHRLGWAFTHVQKGWKHRVIVKVNNGPERLLEEKSEASKDTPETVGLAVVEVD